MVGILIIRREGLRSNPHPNVLVVDLQSTRWLLLPEGACPTKDNCLR